MSASGTTRILVLTPGIGGTDGVSEVTRQYVSALVRRPGLPGDSLEIWSLSDDGRPAWLPPEVGFRTAGRSRLAFASFALRATEVDEDTLVLVMHVHLLAVVLPLTGRGARLVAVLYGIEAWKPLRRLERAGLRKAGRIAAISQCTIDGFRRANPDLAGLSIDVCPPGVPPAAVAAGPVTPGPFALIVGRMASAERYKGHDALIELWPRVCEAVPDAKLLVVGTGDDAARLREKADRLGLSGRVVFAGRVAGEVLASLYRDADFFVMPSAGEGFGLVYLEAMRAGKPCIASHGAAEEVVDDGVDGLIVDGGDREALEAAIVRLFVDRDLRGRLGAAATEKVRTRFSAERFERCVRDTLGLGEVPLAC